MPWGAYVGEPHIKAFGALRDGGDLLAALTAGSSVESRLDERWSAYFDTDDELVFYCPECAAREFADD